MSEAVPAGGPRTFREQELKFRVHGLYRLPDLDGSDGVVVEEAGTIGLTAVYHDTEDLRLAREGVTLRRREGGHDDGWHLKLPRGKAAATAGVRDELRLPLSDGPGGSPPDGLLDLVQAIVRDSPVGPVATLRTERTTRLLRDADGELLGELVDDTVSVLDATAEDAGADGGAGSRVVARFRELELELAETVAPDALHGLVDRLTTSGATAGQQVPKAVRALGPAAAAPAEVPEPAQVRPADPARLAIAAHLARHTRALRAADVDVRRDLPDAVHQMRVSCRRLRSGLRVFRPLLDREWADALRAELAWTAGALGAYRDAEVLLARLEEHAGELPADQPVDQVRALLRRRLERTMAQARAEALTTLRSGRYLRLHDALVVAARDPLTLPRAESPSAEVLPPLVAHAWKRLAKAVRRVLADEASTPGEAPHEEWHETRKAAKKARYAADACAPVLGEQAAGLGEQLSRVTDVLGEHQDGVVAAHELALTARTPRVGGPLGFALGILHEVERAHVRADRARMAELWPQVRRRRYRRWLG